MDHPELQKAERELRALPIEAPKTLSAKARSAFMDWGPTVVALFGVTVCVYQIAKLVSL